MTVASPYRPPKNGIDVSVTTSVVAIEEETVSMLTSALVEDLTEVGLKATVDVHSPGSDELALNIDKWDPGDQVIRTWVGFGQGQPGIPSWQHSWLRDSGRFRQ